MASPLPLDLSHFRHQETDLVSIEFGDRGNAVDVSDKVYRCAQKCLERRIDRAGNRPA
jgi:hypothetical protein